MTRYEDFLSPMTNVEQKVLTPIIRRRLVNQQIIQERPNKEDFDVFKSPEYTAIPVTFVDC